MFFVVEVLLYSSLSLSLSLLAYKLLTLLVDRHHMGEVALNSLVMMLDRKLPKTISGTFTHTYAHTHTHTHTYTHTRALIIYVTVWLPFSTLTCIFLTHACSLSLHTHTHTQMYIHTHLDIDSNRTGSSQWKSGKSKLFLPVCPPNGCASKVCVCVCLCVCLCVCVCVCLCGVRVTAHSIFYITTHMHIHIHKHSLIHIRTHNTHNTHTYTHPAHTTHTLSLSLSHTHTHTQKMLGKLAAKSLDLSTRMVSKGVISKLLENLCDTNNYEVQQIAASTLYVCVYVSVRVCVCIYMCVCMCMCVQWEMPPCVFSVMILCMCTDPRCI